MSSCVANTAKCEQLHSLHTWVEGLPVLAGLGLAVSEGEGEGDVDVAGLGETDTGGGIRPPSPSPDDGTYS